MIAKDAQFIDTSNLTIEDVVNEIAARLRAQGLQDLSRPGTARPVS
jgi:cytidylate kinase